MKQARKSKLARGTKPAKKARKSKPARKTRGIARTARARRGLALPRSARSRSRGIDRPRLLQRVQEGMFLYTEKKQVVAGRLFKPLRAGQQTVLNAMIDEFERRGLSDLRYLAYMMATVLRECGAGMSPVREGFARTDAIARAYVARQGYRYARPEANGQVYYGRGLVQLTWGNNYRNMDAIFGDTNLYDSPDDALKLPIAIRIMFEGMTRGTFTTHKLSQYFNDTATDWLNARKIINGLDHAQLIASNAKIFYDDLTEASL